LGKGSFATVHLAIHKVSKKRYAAKIIHRKDMSVSVIRALTSEIEILRSIRHPSIVFVREIFGSTDVLDNDIPTVSIVMELMGGGELFDRIIDKQFYSEREAKIALKQILEAIDYCHDLNIVHRDIKPENLLYTNESESATLKLADFGLAVRMTPGVQLTHICGTPTYVAPEVLKKANQGYGLQADLWSIGVILYILLCGCPPFYDDDNNELFLLIQTAEFDFPDKFWGDVSEEAKDLVTKLLAADPERRLNAKETLAHPWLSLDNLSNKDLVPLDIADNLRIFNGKRRMKAVRHSIGAINFMRREASAHNLTSASGSGKWQIARRSSLNGSIADMKGVEDKNGNR
jgi:calcium/calmodulin-dependent protein kinase I